MSATGHFSGTPVSLPSDYAILSRYAECMGDHYSDSDTDDMEDREGINYKSSDTRYQSESRIPRRSSFPASVLRPQVLSVGALPESVVPLSKSRPATENSPLLTPHIGVDINCNARRNSVAAIMFWEELSTLTRYTIPVFGTHLFEYSLVISSVISIGHLSTTALAAITLGSMTASVSGFSIVQGFSSALDTMLPSAWTSAQPHLVGLWAQRMTVVMMISLIPTFAIWFNAEAILLLLRQEPEVARLAALYLKWVSLGLPAYAFNCISRRYFQSQGLFAVPTRIILIVAPINAFLNYILVWGPEPVRLGFIGAPIATSISFNLVSVMSVVYGIFFVPKTAWHPISRQSFTSLGVLVQLGIAGVGQVASEWWSWELVALAASLLGPVALASQSVLLVSASTSFQAPFALGVAASVRIGNLLGEQNAKRAAIAAKTSMVMALAMAGVSSTMFLSFRHSWGYMFNSDPEVVSLVAAILPIVALFQFFDGVSAVTSGILRAIGKQFTGALLNLSAYYVIGIPCGIWLAFKQDKGLQGLWLGLTLSLIYCAVVGTTVCLRTDWDRQVQKVLDRLQVEADKHGRTDQHV